MNPSLLRAITKAISDVDSADNWTIHVYDMEPEKADAEILLESLKRSGYRIVPLDPEGSKKGLDNV